MLIIALEHCRGLLLRCAHPEGQGPGIAEAIVHFFLYKGNTRVREEFSYGGMGYLAQREGDHRSACGECGDRKRIRDGGGNPLGS